MKRLWPAACLVLVLPLPLQAQCTDERDAEREITGRVVSPDGDPLPQVFVRLWGIGCTTETDSAGLFTLPAPDRPVRIQAIRIGYKMVEYSLRGLGPQTVSLRLGRMPNYVEDYSQFSNRPPTPDTVTEVAGCYWIGVLGPWPRIVQLRSDGTVPEIAGFDHGIWGFPADSAESYAGLSPTGWWQFSADSSNVEVGVGFRRPTRIMFELDLAPPIDWSLIPAILHSLSDNLSFPRSHRSFVTRVECPTGPSSP